MTRLILCETSQQIQYALANSSVTSQLTTILSLSPEATWECQKHKVSFLRLDDYYDERELFAHADRAFQDVHDWIAWTDEFLQSSIPLFKDNNFSPASASEFTHQANFYEFFSCQFMVSQFLKAENIAEILLWPWVSEEPDWNLQFKSSFYPVIFREIALERGIPIQVLPDLNSGATGPRSSGGRGFYREPFSKVRSTWTKCLILILNRTGLRDYSRLFRSYSPIKALRATIRAMMNSFSSSERILFLGYGYDIDSVVDELNGQRYRIDRLEVDYFSLRGRSAIVDAARVNLSPYLEDAWSKVKAEERFWRPLKDWKIPNLAPAEKALEFWWKRVIPDLWAGYCQASDTLRKSRYRAVVSWEASAGMLSSAMLQAAAHNSIPRVIYQHGSAGRIAISYWHSYLNDAELFLVYGTGTANHIQKNFQRSQLKADIVPVGSSRLDNIATRNRYKRNSISRYEPAYKRKVLYVPTSFNAYGRAFSELNGYPHINYFELQQCVLEIFKDHPDSLLLYKDFAAGASIFNPIPAFIEQNIPNGRVIRGWKLPELFWQVDAIILDHVCTALGEALLTEKPIIVYTPAAAESLESAESLRLLRKRSIVAVTPLQFQRAIRDYLSESLPSVNFKDTEYRRAYSTCFDDGDSARRAATEILNYSAKRNRG